LDNKKEGEMKLKNKKEMSKKAYEEWLAKKEEYSSLLRSSSINNIDFLPPFYPSSRVIPFGR
jgi:hypothetical protein